MTKEKSLITRSKKDMWARFGFIAMVMFAFAAFASVAGMAPILAGGTDLSAVDGIMTTVLDLVGGAAKYVGAVIILWGVFQMILAFRREDSEGISKQITTIVVGGLLLGFGLGVPALYETLV